MIDRFAQDLEIPELALEEDEDMTTADDANSKIEENIQRDPNVQSGDV